jgi:hypothetical protein
VPGLDAAQALHHDAKTVRAITDGRNLLLDTSMAFRAGPAAGSMGAGYGSV